MSQAEREQRALTGPVLGTFSYFAIPSLVGLLAISTASIVDGIFVGHFVGADALAAIHFLVPYFTLLFGSSLMLGVGGVVRAGKHLGAGNPRAAASVFSASVFGVLALSSIAALVSCMFDHALYASLGAPPALFEPMREYFRIISPVLIVQLVTMVIYYFVRLGGQPVLATFALVAGALTNVAGDALLVGYLGLGLPGAAWSTGLAQVCQLGLLSTHFRSAQSVRIELPPRFTELWRSALCGVSELVNEVSGGVLMLATNWLLIGRIGVAGVAAFAAVNYATFISLMIFYGVADALHLLVSINLGAGNVERVRRFMWTAASCVLAISGLLVTALLLAGERWLLFFLDRQAGDALEGASSFLQLIWPVFLVNGVNVLIIVYLTAVQRPLLAGTLALSRTMVLPVGFMLAFAAWTPDWPFLLALPVAEWLSFGLALFFLFRARPSTQQACGARVEAVAS